MSKQNPSNVYGLVWRFLMVPVLCCSSYTIKAQQITAAEYFLNQDPGPGNGTAISGIVAGDTISFSTTIPTTGLHDGFHLIALRVKDANGRWSHLEKRGFYVFSAPVSMSPIQAAEYFIDNDPGPGNGLPVSVGMIGDSVSLSVMIPQSLPGGFHTLAIRVKDLNGDWSPFEKRTFYISTTPSVMAPISAAEFFIATDPGPGNGTPLIIQPSGDTINEPFNIEISSSTPLGQYVYALRTQDQNGRWSHHVFDTILVALRVPNDTTVVVNAGTCSKTVTDLDAETLNNEPYLYTLSGATTGSDTGTVSGLSFNAGITTVIYSLINFPSAIDSFLVQVLDNEAPSITCPANMAHGADPALCGAIVNYTVMFSDNCPGAILNQLEGIVSGAFFPTGVTINTFRVTDASGHSTTCSFTVTVTDDLAPQITCPANITVQTDAGLCSASDVNLGSANATDNCSIDSTVNNAPGTFPIGSTQVTWITTDANGLTASCIQSVTVIDTEVPVITSCPADVTVTASNGTCAALVNFSFSATDNCGIDTIIAFPFASGDSIPVGQHLITISTTDVHGNTTTCAFQITVLDEEAPMISCPDTITQNTSFGTCTRVVHFSPLTIDNCPGIINVISTPPSGSAFPVGTTVVNATATDASGNSSTCTFVVIITDQEPPQITCPANVVIPTDTTICAASNVSLGIPLTADNCAIDTTNNDAPLIFPIGITQVNWTTTDVNGLTDGCVQTVMVWDSEPPVITSCPADITVNAMNGNCAAAVIFNAAATDNCALDTITSAPLQSGDLFPVGLTVVTVTATDEDGLTSTCTFSVTVLDVEPPMITCPDTIMMMNNSGLCVRAVDYSNMILTNDNCAGMINVIGTPSSGSDFPVGSTIVTVTATDVAGNSSTCSFIVTITDDEPPQITCPANLTINTEPGLCLVDSVMLGLPVTSDNCGIQSVSNNASLVFQTGIHQVIWTATDVNGNTATCMQSITVLDNEAPTIDCPDNILAFAGPGGGPVVVNYESPEYDDNCPGASIQQTAGLPSGSAFPLGTTVNTFVVTDGSGLTASCSFTVHVRLGRVGINTTSPLAMLHVVDSTVAFTAPFPLPANPGPPPVEGPGARMMWYGVKAAFRAGSVSGTQWDQDSIGLNSFAAGFNTKAKGFASVALGDNTSALDSSSFAIGDGSQATGKSSTAMGFNTIASGVASMASGNSTKASGAHSLAMGSSTSATGSGVFATGSSTIASGDNSASFGDGTRSRGKGSAAFGFNVIARPYMSFAMGRFPDTTTVDLVNWNEQDPVFIIGNGTINTNRNNAVTVLKNGRFGLNLINPLFRFHLASNDAFGGGHIEGVLIENTNANVGEAAISFKTTVIPSANQWVLGQNQSHRIHLNYGPLLNPGGIRMTLDTTLGLGIGTQTPAGPLHSIRGNPSGGPHHPSSFGVLESHLSSYVQFSTQSGMTSGIVSGNQHTTVRSSILFQPDSTIQFTSGGADNRLIIDSDGNTGIGNSSPGAKLDVNGNFILGVTGTEIQEMMKRSVAIDLDTIPSGATLIHTQSFGAPTIMNGSAVIVSPSGVLPAGLILASARVVSSGMVEIRFVNKAPVTVNPVNMTYYFGIIR